MQKTFPVAPDIELVFHPEHDHAYVHFENGDRHPFQADPPSGITRVNAWWLAEAALLAYWPPASALDIWKRAGFACEYLEAGSTNGYLARGADAVIVAFRGTQPDQLQDSADDVDARLEADTLGRVHAGFKHALDRIWPALEPRLETLGQQRPVWFSGHSLGAAVATLAAARYPSTRGICTIGSPRVGDDVFAAAFDERFAGRSWRFVNDHDVVTHVPPPRLGTGRFRHVESPRFIATDGTVSASEPPVPHFFDAVFGSMAHLRELVGLIRGGVLRSAPNALLDHMPKAYAVATWNDLDGHG